MRRAALALAALAPARALLLDTCDFTPAGDAAQAWAPTPAGEITQRAAARCVTTTAGCCSGEPVRGGDELTLGGCAGAAAARALQTPTPQLALAACAARAPSQGWSYSAADATLTLTSNGLCVDIFRWATAPGSPAYTAPCHTADRDPAHQNQEFTPPPPAAPGARLVGRSSGLPLGACGGAAPGAPLALCAAAPGGGFDFYLNASGLLVHAATGLCVDAGVVPPAPPAPTSQFAWPAAGGGPIASTAAPGDAVSPSANGAPLVIAAKGRAFPGAPLQLLADRGAPDSAFVANASRLVHAASGLCVSAAGRAPAREDPPLALAPCDAARRQTPGDFFSSQLFRVPPRGGAPGPIVTSRGGLCVTAEHVWGAANAVAGEVRLIGATCAAGGAPAPAQTFAFLANGTLASAFAGVGGAPPRLVADAGAGAWRGAPVSLQPTAGAATSVFSFAAVGADAAVGTLTHAATGLCLDAAAVPFGAGCLHPTVRGLPFCDAARPLAARVADLVGRLTLGEAQGFTGSGEFAEPCVTDQDAIRRLDVPAARHLVEVTSMAAGSCDTPYGGACATAFASGLVLGASFNRSAWLSHGATVGREIRALANVASADPADPNGNFITLSGHGPDVNQPRDPRNGRIGELISEDPYLTGQVAEKRVRGMQFGADVDAAAYAATGAPLVMLASLKHYTAYSRETGRMGSVGNVSMRDLWETYLPAFERPMTHAAAAGTMCSYMAVRLDGAAGDYYVPSCANPYLLADVVRGYWNRSDATHLTDCGAVANMRGRWFSNFTLAAAASINAGCDMNSATITPTQLTLAVELGLVNASTVRAAAARVLANRFRVGHFDPLETPAAQPLLALGAADVGTNASFAAAAEGVAQGLVLVRNTNGTLPLRPGRRVALLGPQAASAEALRGDCYCTGYAPFRLLSEAVQAANAGGATAVYAGVTMSGNDSSWSDAIAAVGAADAVILALGTDTTVAAEGRDRADGIGLPGLQAAFGVAVLEAAAARGVPVVLVLLHNLPVSFDELVAPATATFKPVDAIVDGWALMNYADELAAALFGQRNRWGRATMTIYPKAYAAAVDLFSYSMPLAPGRSYKYYDGSLGEPLIKFGEGLSYSTFSVACAGGLAPGAAAVAISCNVTHAGGPGGDEVLMAFHRPSAETVARVGGAHALPLRALVGFERVAVAAGAVVPVAFALPADEALGFVDENGATVVYPGLHFIDVSDGAGANVTVSVTVPGAAARVERAPPRPRA